MSDLSSQSKLGQRLLSIQEAAEFFQMSTKTVRRWIAAGDLRAHRLGRQWRISPEDINQYLATRGNWQRSYVS